MHSIAIRQIDDKLKNRLRLEAARQGCSMEEQALRILRAGLEAVTEKRAGVLMLVSTSIFITFAFPSNSSASWSSVGSTIRHGPHHVAQKSTTASPSCFSISSSKSPSVTATAVDI